MFGCVFFFQAEDGIRDLTVTGVQTCALPILVDEVSDPGVAATKLGWWQNEVHQAFAGKPSHPVMRALMPHAPVYGIEERHLQAVIDGCRMDLEQTRYLDFQGLTRYCHLVAGVVGEIGRA